MRGGTIDESFLTGYKVAVVDSCGHVLPGTDFLYVRKHGFVNGCCPQDAYVAMWSLTLPEHYSYFMVVPYSDDWGEQDGGPLIVIADNINGIAVGGEEFRLTGSGRGTANMAWRQKESTWLWVLAIAALAS